MPARDDSVIRGGLIACAIFLVLSLIANFLFWHMGNTAAQDAANANTQLQSANASVQTLTGRVNYLLGVMGIGDFTEAELNNMAESASGDANMEKAVADVQNALSYFGLEYDSSSKNLIALPGYLTTQIRTLSDQYNNAVAQQQQEKARADAEIKVARDAQAAAEDLQKVAEKEVEQLRVQFEEDRNKMKIENGELQDKVNRAVAEHRAAQQRSDRQIQSLQQEKGNLLATIETQRRELNELRNSEFEVAQGAVTYTRAGDQAVMIDLGSADALRTGVKFEVYDANETRVTGAKPKAMVEVVAIRDAHVAEARLIGSSVVNNPIIPGDKIYSPFWAPGRRVRVALAGSIDVDRDGRAGPEDIDILKGAIQSAGAEVAAVVEPGGRRTGKELDSGIRFLVVGERTEVSQDADQEATDRQRREMVEMGAIIDEARQLGITIIPAEKLVGFLRSIDDSITVPLGAAARGGDFRPTPTPPGRRAQQDISGAYRRSTPEK